MTAPAASPPSDTEPEPPPSGLTPEQQAEAARLYRHMLMLRDSGVRQAVIILDGPRIGVRATGERVDVALALKASYNPTVTI